MKRVWSFSLVIVALTACVIGIAAVDANAGATVVIQNNDGAFEGFNDATPWTPTGGNPATTLGQARLNAFQYAADLWGACINSNVTITVRAQMDPQYCDAGSAVLGSAGTTTVHRNFTGAPLADTWYPQALANALRGADMSSTNPDINATFNSNLNGDSGCLGGMGWYYGYDGNPGGDIDFISVVMHEIGHGLGFQTFVTLTTGAKWSGNNDAYMVHLNHAGASPADYPSMSDAQRVTASKADPNLRWTGASVTAAHTGIPVTSGLNGGYVRMYAPNPQESGSSVSHWSKDVSPNEVMEPAYTGANHDPGLAFYLLADIGWTLDAACVCTPDPTTLAVSDTLTTGRSATRWALRIELENLGPGDAVNVNATITENIGWLTMIDPNCAYGNINNGATDWGAPDQFEFDLTSWPGGTFNVDIDLTWEDGCGNDYSDSFTRTMIPPIAVPVAFEQVFVSTSEEAVEIRWMTYADEPFSGFNIYRRHEDQDSDIRLNTNGLVDRNTSSYMDTDVEPGETYYYTMAFVMPDGTEIRSASVKATVGVYSNSLDQNRPNPFNPATEISYRIAGQRLVTLKIYDVAGRLVRTLVDGPQDPGVYSVTWNGIDNVGATVSTGVYFYRLNAGKYTETRRMVLLK
jgi:hypothetical protein